MLLLMSGSRFHNYREGDRSEYLAIYFFSALGLVTSVPRQEDIGFDLVCSIADQEVGRLTFNHQYLVSVKSLSTPDIRLFPTESEDGSLPHIHWLFRNELTLLLAVVDKETQTIRVYSTLPIWFVYFENPDCGAMTLRPRIKPVEGHPDVGRPRKGDAVKEWPGSFHYEVDLGYPILTATVADLLDKDKIRYMKDLLRWAILYGRLSSIQVELGVPYFYWFARTNLENKRPIPAFYANPFPDVKEAQDHVYARVAPTLISLALLYKSKSDEDSLKAVLHLMRSVPAHFIPDVVRAELPAF